MAVPPGVGGGRTGEARRDQAERHPVGVADERFSIQAGGVLEK